MQGNRIARFSDYDDAIRFARQESYHASTEVSEPSGLIAQFSMGRASPEFAHLDR
jgi:hypothetical protein